MHGVGGGRAGSRHARTRAARAAESPERRPSNEWPNLPCLEGEAQLSEPSGGRDETVAELVVLQRCCAWGSGAEAQASGGRDMGAIHSVDIGFFLLGAHHPWGQINVQLTM